MTKASKKQPAAALQYLDPAFFEHSPKHKAALEETRSSQEIARAVYDLRTRAGISAKELARAAGLSPRALEKLESGESPRQSLSQLRQVAAALGKKVELKIVAAKGKSRAKKPHSAEPEKKPRRRSTSAELRASGEPRSSEQRDGPNPSRSQRLS